MLVLAWLLTRKESGPTSLDSTKLVWPVRVDGAPGRGGSAVTQEYHPPEHQGVDIAVRGHYRDARADVLAVASGRVAYVRRGERGWFVRLNHGDWASSYLHMSSVRVGQGEVVVAGQALGRMGYDPLDANRVVHLHLQIAPRGVPVDPGPYLKES